VTGNADVRTVAACKTCDGTGKILCLRSAFVGSGFRRERCGICAGTGKSAYRDDPVYVRWQHDARIMDAALRAAPKGLDDIALGKLARQAVEGAGQ
jgi:hypothetical protein